jgi:hypothetical protein
LIDGKESLHRTCPAAGRRPQGACGLRAEGAEARHANVIPRRGGLWHASGMIRPDLPLLLAGLLLAGAASAEAPEVVATGATRDADGSWTISVSLRHPDTGWDHYADGWQVLTPEGRVIGERALTHPHVDEQPFTRSLSGVRIPDGLNRVLIRPHCSIDGWSARPAMLVLPDR